MPTERDTPQLENDLHRLTDALWAAVAVVGGEPSAALCQALGAEAVALRSGSLARSAFGAHVATLGEDDLEAAARAHALDCNLENVAEQRERMRALAARRAWTDGLTAGLDSLIDNAGYGILELTALFERALVMPVITAHPTEARRRSSLDHLSQIADLLALPARDPLVAEVLALHATEDARARKPTPLDEVETALDVFRRSLLDVTPRIYRTIEDHIAVRLGTTFRLPTFLRWGSWVGGDRDGNPNVTAPITRAALSRQHVTVVTRYLADVELLGRSLSLSTLRARPGAVDELLASIELDRQRLPEVAAHARPRTANEPWREKFWYMQARLRATLEHREEGYVDAQRYRADLAVIDRTMRAAGFALVAERKLRDALRRVDVFGFHLASLDLRQHSGVHDAVVDELLGGGYTALDEAGRRAKLRDVLARPIMPVQHRDALGAQAREVLGTLDVVGRARRELGPRACERYVVSFTREVSDLLEVAFLARCAGLAPGELRPVPLLEQLEDLERADQIAKDTLADPILATELAGELEVMIGYSDSGKQVGYVASAMALRRAQQQLAAVVPEGTLLTIFHGRGGALGRGGGPASEAIRAQPPEAIRGRVRVTEQGETVTTRYSDPEIAERDLELTVGAVLAAAALPVEADRDDEVHLLHAAQAARRVYLELTSDEDRLARYTVAATPIEDVAHLPIGSRPASRGGTKLTLEALRAIPWVFSWTQSRHGIPGWFGVGTALEALAAAMGAAQVRALVGRSRFFAQLVHNCEVSLVRSDIDVAAEYAKLADPDAAQLFEMIETEHTRTVAALRDVLGMDPLLATRPYLAASVARRNPHLDVLSHIQIEALRRRRAGTGDTERLARIIFTTINGIAAGLQTSG